MDIKRIVSICFSPTGGVRRAADLFCEAMGLPVVQVDLCCREPQCEFAQGDMAVVAAPVYGGRIPAVAVERLSALSADGVSAVLLAVYGNRDYDDALVELYDVAGRCGMRVVAAAALLAEHSIFRSAGHGRPDAADAAAEAEFARMVAAALESMTDDAVPKPLDLKGNRPYKVYGGVPLKPRVTGRCTRCGACAAKCPVGAIPTDAPDRTDNAKCITCMRCVAMCPNGAREINLVSERLWRLLPFVARPLNRRLRATFEKRFAAANAARREPEFFM